MLTKRSFLRYACCMAASGSTRACLAASGDSVIDVHHHVSPPIWFREAKEQIGATNRNSTLITNWVPSKSIDEMDRYGIATSVASVTNPGIWFGEAEAARRLARGCNEYMAQLKQNHGHRFAGLASLPLPDTQGSLEEIAYAVDVLKLDGVGLMTNYDSKGLGDAAFEPVLEELNRRSATVFVHPTSSACCSAQIPDVSFSAIEFPIDTTRTIVSLLFSGALSKYPSVKWIFSHAGGAIPMLAQRVTSIMEAQPALRKRIPNGALHELKKLYYDLALASNPMAISALTKLVNASQVLFGSDYPLASPNTALVGIEEYNFDVDVKAAILRSNAQRLFPNLRTL